MAATGLPMRTLQEWMGHRDIATTQIYADYSPSSHEAAYIQEAFGSTDSSLRASEQITGRDSEAAGDLDDCGDAQVADAALGSTDLDGVHPRAVGESFLGDPEALAVGADVLADLQLGLHRDDPPSQSQ